MAYYRVESVKIEPPPPPEVLAMEEVAHDADHATKARIKKEHDDRVLRAKKEHELAVKRVEKRNADLKHAVDEWVSVVIDERTGHEVCVCEGPAHAHYIAGLLNDRPPR